MTLTKVESDFQNDMQAVLRFLQSKERQFPSDIRKFTFYAGALSYLFGTHSQRRKDMRSMLNEKVFEHLRKVCKVFVEIQENLKKGRTEYTVFETTFPLAKDLMIKYPKGIKQISIFSSLKRASYELLAFPQGILLYEDPELEILKTLEKTRRLGFSILNSQLKDFLPVEENKEDRFSWNPTPERALALIKLYYNQGALIIDEKVLHFSTLVEIWKKGRSQAEKQVQQLLSPLELNDWEFTEIDLSEPTDPINTLLQLSKDGFQDSLIEWTLYAMQRNLRMNFLEGTKELLRNRFRNSESLRSDVAYFTAYPSLLYYNVDFSTWGWERSSQEVLQPIKLFLYFREVYQPDKAIWPSLFQIILFKDLAWKVECVDGFSDQKRPAEGPELEKVWDCFSFFLKHVDVEQPLKILRGSLGRALPLFSLMLKDLRKSELLYNLFHDLKSDFPQKEQFRISFSLVEAFFERNFLDFNEELANYLSTAYKHAANLLKINEVKLEGLEVLFLEVRLKEKAEALKKSEKNGEQFFSCMKRGKFQKISQKKMLEFFRAFVLNPSARFSLELLSEKLPTYLREALEGKEESFVEEVLFASIERGEEVVTEGDKKRVHAIVERLYQQYHFSPEKLFLLYVGFLFLPHREREIGYKSRVVSIIEDFFPLEWAKRENQLRESYYLLYQYTVSNSRMGRWQGGVLNALEELNRLIAFKKEWVAAPFLKNFILPPKEYRSMEERVDWLSRSLASACYFEHVGKLAAILRSSFLNAFLPPIQPLTDHCRITMVDVEKGIRWCSSSLETHLGQYKLLSAKRAVYLHWDVAFGLPVFFFSFSDPSSFEARSHFLVLHLSLSEEKLKKFFILLSILGQHIFQEKIEEPDEETLKKRGGVLYDEKNLASSLYLFIGAEETYYSLIDPFDPEELQEIWHFIRSVKVNYRNAFFFPEPQIAPLASSIEIAAQANIYPRGSQGILIPPFLEKVEPCPEFYMADLSFESILSCRDSLFTKKEKSFSPLGQAILVTDGTKEIQLPLYFYAQRAEDLGGHLMDSRAPSSEEKQGVYLTLGVKVIEGTKFVDDNKKVHGERFLSLPFRYREEALKNDEEFVKLFRLHLLYLKARWYFQLTFDNLIYPPENGEKSLSGDS